MKKIILSLLLTVATSAVFAAGQQTNYHVLPRGFDQATEMAKLEFLKADPRFCFAAFKRDPEFARIFILTYLKRVRNLYTFDELMGMNSSTTPSTTVSTASSSSSSGFAAKRIKSAEDEQILRELDSIPTLQDKIDEYSTIRPTLACIFLEAYFRVCSNKNRIALYEALRVPVYPGTIDEHIEASELPMTAEKLAKQKLLLTPIRDAYGKEVKAAMQGETFTPCTIKAMIEAYKERERLGKFPNERTKNIMAYYIKRARDFRTWQMQTVDKKKQRKTQIQMQKLSKLLDTDTK